MLRNLDLAALNSATKYPSIPTYHPLDPANGNLLPYPTEFSSPVVLTEKIDGTNARIIVLPTGEYLIGSREELLHAGGDLVHNPALGIVDTLSSVAPALTPPADGVRVLYFEVYGGKTTPAARQYTSNKAMGFRLFDVAHAPLHVLGWRRERIAHWRENLGQEFLSEDRLVALAESEGIARVPCLATVPASQLPTGLKETRQFISEHLPASRATLDDQAGGAPEGIVLRSASRYIIAKARIQDYDRTLRKLGIPT